MHVKSARRGSSVRISIAPAPDLPPEKKKSERRFINRAHEAVRGVVARVRDLAVRRKLEGVIMLLVLVALVEAHRRGYLPTKSQLERKVEALLRGRLSKTSNQLSALQGLTQNPALKSKVHGRLPVNMCSLTPKLCEKGVLPRHLMPQANMASLLRDLPRNTRVTTELVDAASAVPLQKELRLNKVLGIAASANAGKAPVLMARVGDNLVVIDGHHRWAAAAVAGRQVAAKILHAHALKSVMPLVGRVLAHPSTTFAAL